MEPQVTAGDESEGRIVDTVTDFKNLDLKTALHQNHIMKWLSRYRGKVQSDYLFLPSEKRKRKEFEK